jgi:hypothetical protein
VSTDKDIHLDEDQLLWAVVEETELPLPLQEHLSACPQCRTNKERFEQDLARLGQMAERFAPSLRGPVSLPVEKPRGSAGWLWGWRAYASATVAAALVVIVVWSFPMFRDTPGDNGAMLAREMQETEQFMAEVSMLVENRVRILMTSLYNLWFRPLKKNPYLMIQEREVLCHVKEKCFDGDSAAHHDDFTRHHHGSGDAFREMVA